MDKRSSNGRRITHHVHQKEGRKASAMCELLSPQPCYKERSVPPTIDWGSLGPIKDSQILHQVRHQGRLPQHTHQRRRRMEDNVYIQKGNIRILGYAIRASQRTSGIPKVDQQDSPVIHRHLLYCLSGRCVDILGYPGATPKRREKHDKSDSTARNDNQTNKMRIPHSRNRISRIYHQSGRGKG